METDFTPIYGGDDQALRPAYIPRQSGAGFRAPGFIGRGLAGAQPQSAPQSGATSSGDAMAAMRGLYASRAGDGGLGVGEGQGGITGGQQGTRQAQSFQDLMASMAMGGLALSGPGGFGAYMMGQDRLANQNGPVGWGDVRQAMNPFSSGNNVIGRAAGAMYDSVIGSGPSLDRPLQGPNFDGSTVDRSLQGPNPDGSVVTGDLQGPNFDGSTIDMGPVQGPTESGATVDSADNSSGRGVDTGAAQGPNPDGSTVDTRRNGGMIGRPGEKPKPKPILAHTGEYVQRPEAVNKYGPSAMAALNSLRAPASAVKAATGASKKPAPGAKKAPPKKGGAMDALARMKARG